MAYMGNTSSTLQPCHRPWTWSIQDRPREVRAALQASMRVRPPPNKIARLDWEVEDDLGSDSAKMLARNIDSRYAIGFPVVICST